MKNIQQLCGTVVLICVLTLSAFAGQIQTGIIDPPPSTTADGQIQTGSSETLDLNTQIALNLLQSVMSLF
jgi:hypothetical protein